jgi:hypothetical protein
MAYHLELLALQCLKNQEVDGDEIVVKLDGKTIFHWEDTTYRWAAELKLDDWTDYYDFRQNQLRTKAGTIEVEEYKDFGFLLTNLTEPTVVELWESDEGNLFRGEDDKLGTLVVDEQSASPQAQTHDFTAEGAHYRMTYAVVVA